ncbi:MAG TPA: creatininase family protein [Chthoniobacteraceae bacterium]|nr:creatininase family protein [Chthoniobacteraceae bacterium]
MNLAELTSTAVEALPREIPVIIPIAALEQHGKHLPLFTDSFLLGEIVRRVSVEFRERALFAPLLWLGNSDHHLDFQGTLSAEPRLYLDLLTGLAENYLRYGFRRLLFLNGHGGNDIPGQQAIFELRQRHRERNDLLLLCATYWGLGAQPQREDPSFVQSAMGHACEWETSMMLQLVPQLVGDYQQVAAVEFGTSFAPAARAWITRERTHDGHIGRPQAASVEKGETLFRSFTVDVVALIERMIRWDGKSWNG